MRTRGINVGIAGIGNCASSLVQAIEAAKVLRITGGSPGIITPVLGGYEISDITVTCAFDVDTSKVGLDLGQAIFAAPNCARRYHDVPLLGIVVRPGLLADGLHGPLEHVVS